jgi:ABC-type nitrate/sulfonate/bicarbonate transport system permease component
MKIFKPFEQLDRTKENTITLVWLILLISFWMICSLGQTHLFPTVKQVLTGFKDLWNAGLVVHIGSSLWLCARAVFMSILISLAFCYLSPMPILKPLATFISKLRYLPLTGISFYIAILINDARAIQVWVLVVFMTTFLITSILSMIKDIPDEEFDHARTLGCSRWEILWEIVIKGRFDYIFELVRQNLAIVWMMLVTVESILVAAGGLGFLIKNNDKLGDSGKVIALQIIIVVVGLILDYGWTKTRKLIFRYSNF